MSLKNHAEKSKCRTSKTGNPRELLPGAHSKKGLEGASIGKIADRLNIHPSLIIHYFKTKERMKLALVDLLIEKYNAPEFLSLEHIEDNEERFHAS